MNTTKLGTIAIVTAAGFFAAMALPAVSLAEDKEPLSIEVLAEESATTPAHHQALAAYYRQKADDERKEVKRHRQMAASFSSRSAGAEAGMRSHCDRLAAAAEQSATEYDAIAAIHEAKEAEAGKAAK